MDLSDPRLLAVVRAQPHPLVFVTVSGAHLYGFPSPDSDWDLRGTHVLPLRGVVGLDVRDETIDSSPPADGLDVDLVSHDVRKFFGMLLKKNGYVLEQLFSPLVLRTTPAHAELREIARSCLTRNHYHHYAGFSQTSWKLFLKESPRRLKPLLYTYRVLLTGIHLLRTGEVEANLLRLNEEFRLPQVPDLVARKQSGPEQGTLDEADVALHERAFERLDAELTAARDASPLPGLPTGRDALNDLLVRLRLAEGHPAR